MDYHVTAPDCTSISYDCVGEGPPVVLVHGFGASRAITWSNTGWYQTLTRAGRKVIAIDCRGHGKSGKPHDPAAYDEGRMAADIVAVMDAQGILQTDIMGYSMGGFLAMRLMNDAPARLRRVVLGGVGETYFRASRDQAEIIAQGFLAKDPATITDPMAREFRAFCEKAGNDLEAMAACIRRARLIFTPGELRTFSQPVLVVCGELDDTSGPAGPLADAFAQGRALTIPKRNHHSTVGDRAYKDAAVAFLA
jgi:pimeloyl-ACP methyl ester carboxylesterase